VVVKVNDPSRWPQISPGMVTELPLDLSAPMILICVSLSFVRQLIQHVNGVAVSTLPYNDVLAQIKAGGRPLTLVFALPTDAPSGMLPASLAARTPAQPVGAVLSPRIPPSPPGGGEEIKTLQQAKAKIASLQAAVSKQQDLLRRLQEDRKKLKSR